MPYTLSVIDNWDHHEGSSIDRGTYGTAEEVLTAAREVITKSLLHIWKREPNNSSPNLTGKELYEKWTWSGDNVYIFASEGSSELKPKFQPYDYALLRAEEIATPEENIRPIRTMIDSQNRADSKFHETAMDQHGENNSRRHTDDQQGKG